jgi:hypothetical protein
LLLELPSASSWFSPLTSEHLIHIWPSPSDLFGSLIKRKLGLNRTAMLHSIVDKVALEASQSYY